MQTNLRKEQSGMSLIGSIFIMVVLSAVGVFMLSLNAMQHTSTSLSLQSNRALYAAESGMEWAAWFVRTNDSCPSLPEEFDIGNFTISLELNSCNVTNVSEGINDYNIFDVQVTASTKNSDFGDTDFSSRTLHGRIVGNF